MSPPAREVRREDEPKADSMSYETSWSGVEGTTVLYGVGADEGRVEVDPADEDEWVESKVDDELRCRPEGRWGVMGPMLIDWSSMLRGTGVY
jgi:hypothetical protein